MMAPTVVLRDGRAEIALGSAGSNRIRSAILQTIMGVVDYGLPAQEAVSSPRIHVEGGELDAEPGIDDGALTALEGTDWTVRRWSEQNLFFGGVQAVARNPESGALSGGGDPRRGGAATVVG
jgi:gamma-glutamyltranspeptidase/glutathione hydrolase